LENAVSCGGKESERTIALTHYGWGELFKKIFARKKAREEKFIWEESLSG